MLEGLDKIDWKNLHHAYGEADDVPQLIRELAYQPQLPDYGDYGDIDSTPYYVLFNEIRHQGDFYEAAVFVIPFLIELLTYDFVHNKAAILDALADNLYLYDRQKEVAQLDSDEPIEYLLLIKRACDNVCAGAEIFVELLTNDDEKIRNAAHNLLHAIRDRDDKN